MSKTEKRVTYMTELLDGENFPEDGWLLFGREHSSLRAARAYIAQEKQLDISRRSRGYRYRVVRVTREVLP